MQNARDRLGSDREIDQILAGAAEKFADDDGTLPLPSMALLLRAVAT